MECTEVVRSNGSINWDQAVQLCLKAIASKHEPSAVAATLAVADLSRDAPESALEATIPALVGLLGELRPRVQAAAARALCCMMRWSNGKMATAVGNAGSIRLILRALPGSEQGLRRALLRCLSFILSFDTQSRATLARTGGLGIILDMFPGCTDGLKWYLVDILSALALLREVRRQIVTHDAVQYLVEAVSFGRMFSRTRAAQAVGLLGITVRVRHILVELGAVSALLGLMRDGDAPARIVAGNALGIISSHVDYFSQVGQAGAIPLYVELLKGSDPRGREIAEDVFCLLALADDNARLVLLHLVRILGEEDDDAKGAAVDVLWSLAGYKNIVPYLRDSCAIAVLIELLQNGNGDVKEKAAGAIAQLSYTEGNKEVLAEVGAIPVLIDLMKGDSEELKEFAAEALSNFSDDPRYRESVSEIYDIPSFLVLQDRLIRMRGSDEHMDRSMRMMSVEQLVTHREFS